MTVDRARRQMLPLAFLAAAGAAAPAGAKSPSKVSGPSTAQAPAPEFGLDPSGGGNQSRNLQAAIDQTAARGATLVLPPGTYSVGDIQLRPGSRISGAGATLKFAGGDALLSGLDARGICLVDMSLDGAHLPVTEALLMLRGCADARLTDLRIGYAGKTAIRLERVSGRVSGCSITNSHVAALMSLDAIGLEISHNVIDDCGDNGILVWRTTHGEDATSVAFNRISGIRNASGGSGQYGNGIGIYRAGRVSVANNRITDCAYSAIRANEASNVQMIANSAERIGEVALYAEAADERAGAAGFEGAVISNNIVDGAAAGIVVTNFSNGGRLAVVQGNLVRNLARREHETVDKRGEGIAIEADAVVSNNVIENAPACGVMIGWGRHMRDVVVTGNLIRRAGIGIAVSGDSSAGQCLIAQNMISGSRDGAIRAMDHARPVGPDLTMGKGPRHVLLAGNVAV